MENIDFDTQACVLRLKGRNIEENQYVKMGAYHTLDLELNRKLAVYKDEWDSVALDRIEASCNPAKVSPPIFISFIYRLQTYLIMGEMYRTRMQPP